MAARVRAPAVAGSFYPAAAPLLAQQVDQWLEQAPACPPPTLAALIVPHAEDFDVLPLVARRRGLSAELLDLRSSGDTAGDKSEVVGYGAFAFYPRA